MLEDTTPIGTAEGPAVNADDYAFETPVAQVAEVKATDISPAQTRFVFFPGNVASATRLRNMAALFSLKVKDRPALPFYGGAECSARSLTRTPGVILRGLITPLEAWYSQAGVPADFGEGNKVLLKEVPGTGLVRIAWNPIEDINDVLTMRLAEVEAPAGIVEFPYLAAKGYTTEDLQRERAQQILLPLGKLAYTADAAPLTLNELREVIHEGRKATSESLLHDMADTMLGACDTFENWATQCLDAVEGKMQEGGKYRYNYTELHLTLLKQLGRHRQDAPVRQLMARAANAQPQPSAAGPAVSDEYVAAMKEANELKRRELDLMEAQAKAKPQFQQARR